MNTTTINLKSNSNSTSSLNQWSLPHFKEVIVNEESIEIIYKEFLSNSVWSNSQPTERVFKIIFSCVDGRWNKSEKIYGKIIPASDETYEFED